MPAHVSSNRHSHLFSVAGKPEAIHTSNSTRCVGDKRTTLIVAWWGPSIRAEPGAPGQGPCRVAPSPAAVQGSQVKKSKQESEGLQQLAAGPSLRAEPKGAGYVESPFPQVNEQSASSSACTSSSESGISVDNDSEVGAQSGSEAEADSEVQSGCSSAAGPESQQTPAEHLWVSQCQLSSQQQQHFMRLKQESQGDLVTNTRGTVSTLDRNQHDHDNAITLGSRSPDAAGMQQACQQGPHGFNPATITPVWLPVGEIGCETKQGKQEMQCQDRQQVKGQADQLHCLQRDQQDNAQTELHSQQEFAHQPADEQGQQGDKQDNQQDSQQRAQQHGQHHGQHQHDWQHHGQHHDWQDNQQDGDEHDCQLQHDCVYMQRPLKRSKQDVNHNYKSFVPRQQPVQLPLPPLRFFLQCADEISLVYLPRTTSIS